MGDERWPITQMFALDFLCLGPMGLEGTDGPCSALLTPSIFQMHTSCFSDSALHTLLTSLLFKIHSRVADWPSRAAFLA
jgi:hypothetical protein